MKIKMNLTMRRILKRNEKRKRVDQIHLVKRALFIDGNLIEHHRQTCELLKKEMSKIEEEQSAKYNFDFKNEEPLEGDYEWIQTDNLNSVKKLKPNSNGNSSSNSVKDARRPGQGRTKPSEQSTNKHRLNELIESNYSLRSKVSSERKQYR